MEEKYFKLGHRFILGAVVSLFFSASLLLFGPFKIYIRENQNLWFGINTIIWPVIIITLIVFVIATLICSLPKEGIHKLLCCLVFGVALAIYIQGNFFNTKYGSGAIDGSEIAWKDYTTYGAIDCALWAACVALPFAIMMVFKKRWRAVLISISVAILIVQSFSLAAGLIGTSDDLNKATCEVTSDGIYDLSKQDNTLVFVLDDFDQSYLDKTLKNNEDYKDKLIGFTEYTNTLALGAKSIEAFPSLISGQAFKKETKYLNYIDNIWSDNSLYAMLDKKGVDTRIYANSTFFGEGATKYVSNVIDSATQKDANTAIIKTIYKYTFFEYAQHYLKKYFWLDSSVFESYKSSNTYKQNDAEFYMNYQNNVGFTYKSDYNNALRIYNLQGASTPYTLTSEGKSDFSGTSLNEQIQGNFTMLFEMFDNLKENGMYNNATIIITSACGTKSKSQNPILLVKPSGVDEGFTVNKAPISLADFPATIASLVTDDYKSYGERTFFETEENAQRVRYFYLNTGSNNDTRIEEYKTTKLASDYNSLELNNFYRTNNGLTNLYELGDMLTFDIDATANSYCVEGFRNTTGWRTPLAGPISTMTIPIKDIPKDAQDLHVYIGVNQVDLDTTMQIMADGTRVYQKPITDDLVKTGLNFTVPISLVKTDKELTLTFKFAHIDKKELEKDITKRTMTISFDKFMAYTQ